MTSEEVAVAPLTQVEEGQLKSYNLGLTALHPPQKSVMRVHIIIIALLLGIPSAILDFALNDNLGTPSGAVLIPVAAIALIAILSLPTRRFRRWGYDMGDEHLRILRGFLFRKDTIVPFNRVQHIDVSQGPIERFFGVSTLVVHTAGTHNSTVFLHGLEPSVADDMREVIKGHIRQEMI